MSKPSFRSCAAYVCLALPLLLFPIWTAARIWSFSFGADPRMFLTLANALALGHPISEVTRFVIPGWPLFLAAGFRLVGPFVACMSNVLLFLLTLVLLARFLGELLHSSARGLLAALVCMLFLFAGYPQNPHYLLWPYRQTPFYLPTLLALFAARRAAVAQTARASLSARAVLWILVSLAAVALATSVRETSPIVLPSIFAYFCFAPLSDDPLRPAPPRTRIRLLAVLSALCALAALAGLLLVLAMRTSFSNMQTQFLFTWFRRFLSQPVADLPLWRILDSLRVEYGVLGLCLLFLGLIRAGFRRNRQFLFLFALPALSYLLFDGLFKSNPRYVLSTLFFSVPLAALGADNLISLAEKMLARRPRIATALRSPVLEAILSLVLLAFAFWRVLPSVHVGSRVTQSEVERMIALLRPHASPSRPVVLDARHDVLLDLLPVFSPWPTLHVYDANTPGMFLDNPPLPFIQSQSRHAIRPASIAPDAIAVLEGVADLQLVPDGTFSLGSVPFDLVLLIAPTNRSLDFPLPLPPPSSRVPPPPVTFLRLAVPVSAATNPVSVSLNGHLLSAGLAPGRNFIPVPSLLLAGLSDSNRVLHLSAPAPFPSAIHPEWISPDSPLSIRFGPMVAPSTDHFLSQEFLEFNDTPVYDKVYPGWPLNPYAREFCRPGVISLPEFPPMERPLSAILSFQISGLHNEPEAHLFASVSFPGRPDIPAMEATVPHTTQPQSISFRLPPMSSMPSEIALALSRDITAPIETFPNRRRFNSCIHSVSITPLYPVDALALDFTVPSDDALLGEGFFRQEGLHTPAAGRWSAPLASLVVPPLASLPSSGTVRVSLLADPALRPAEDALAVSFRLPGAPPLPATRENLPDSSLARFSASVPARFFSLVEPTDLEILVSPPFLPSSAGSRDSRTLGLFLKSFTLQPSESE